jgi:hypothetical protein
VGRLGSKGSPENQLFPRVGLGLAEYLGDSDHVRDRPIALAVRTQRSGQVGME